MGVPNRIPIKVPPVYLGNIAIVYQCLKRTLLSNQRLYFLAHILGKREGACEGGGDGIQYMH